MILKKFTVLISSLLFLCSSVALSAEERGIKLHVDRFALVIGNSAYQTAPLKNPLNDAKDMAETLRNLGFHGSYHHRFRWLSNYTDWQVRSIHEGRGSKVN